MIEKTLKISIWFLVIYIVFSSFCFSEATSLGEMVTQTNNFIRTGQNKAQNIDINNSVSQIVDIGRILTTAGVAVMLGVTSYMGIKYLTSGPETKGKLKVQLIGVVVSGVVIFGAYYIWKLVVNIASGFGT